MGERPAWSSLVVSLSVETVLGLMRTFCGPARAVGDCSWWLIVGGGRWLAAGSPPGRTRWPGSNAIAAGQSAGELPVNYLLSSRRQWEPAPGCAAVGLGPTGAAAPKASRTLLINRYQDQGRRSDMERRMSMRATQPFRADVGGPGTGQSGVSRCRLARGDLHVGKGIRW